MSIVLALNGGDKNRSGSRDRATLSARGYFAFILSEIDGTPIVSTFLYRTIRTCPSHKSRSHTRLSLYYRAEPFSSFNENVVETHPVFSYFFFLTGDQVSFPGKNKLLSNKMKTKRKNVNYICSFRIKKKIVFEETTTLPLFQFFKQQRNSKKRLTVHIPSKILLTSSSRLLGTRESSLYRGIVRYPRGVRLISIETPVRPIPRGVSGSIGRAQSGHVPDYRLRARQCISYVIGYHGECLNNDREPRGGKGRIDRSCR